IQLPYRSDGHRATDAELEKLSTRGVAVGLTVRLFRTLITSQSARAPEKIRTNLKVAGSMLLPFSAARHKSELLAKAIIANSVRMKIRVGFTTDEIENRTLRGKR